MDDDREYARVRFDGSILFGSAGGPRELQGRCINLSHTGLQFETAARLEEGSILEAVISTDDRKFRPMEITFVIVRIEGARDGYFRVSGEITMMDGRALGLR